MSIINSNIEELSFMAPPSPIVNNNFSQKYLYKLEKEKESNKFSLENFDIEGFNFNFDENLNDEVTFIKLSNQKFNFKKY